MDTLHLQSITQLHQLSGISKPKHPLFSIVRFEDLPKIETNRRTRLMTGLYQITMKKACPCKMQYGQTPFDFDEGVIACFAPRQVYIIDKDFAFATSGWQLSIHPDFLRMHPLATKMKSCGFFDYNVNEALILSEDEQQTIETIFGQIEKEYRLPIDQFSREVVLAGIELLLTYCNRFYHRQFITRSANGNELLSKVERILDDHFSNATDGTLPTASYLAAKLNRSTKYLSDCLKQLTGQTAQQLIHNKLIEHAKDILTTTELSVSEIAYQLGFEYPQSFSKLFKSKTDQTPLAYRQSFN